MYNMVKLAERGICGKCMGAVISVHLRYCLKSHLLFYLHWLWKNIKTEQVKANLLMSFRHLVFTCHVFFPQCRWTEDGQRLRIFKQLSSVYLYAWPSPNPKQMHMQMFYQWGPWCVCILQLTSRTHGGSSQDKQQPAESLGCVQQDEAFWNVQVEKRYVEQICLSDM
jgi:hypothetical protein